MKGMGLHRDVLWCGPAALSAITGRNAEYCAVILKRRRATVSGKRRDVKSTWPSQLVMFLRRHGFAVRELPVEHEYLHRGRLTDTFGRWLRGTERRPDAYYLIGVTGHWIVVRGNRLVDSHNPDGVPARTVYQRCRVMDVYEVTRA
jgi:hypothetical protein